MSHASSMVYYFPARWKIHSLHWANIIKILFEPTFIHYQRIHRIDEFFNVVVGCFHAQWSHWCPIWDNSKKKGNVKSLVLTLHRHKGKKKMAASLDHFYSVHPPSAHVHGLRQSLFNKPATTSKESVEDVKAKIYLLLHLLPFSWNASCTTVTALFVFPVPPLFCSLPIWSSIFDLTSHTFTLITWWRLSLGKPLSQKSPSPALILLWMLWVMSRDCIPLCEFIIICMTKIKISNSKAREKTVKSWNSSMLKILYVYPLIRIIWCFKLLITCM